MLLLFIVKGESDKMAGLDSATRGPLNSAASVFAKSFDRSMRGLYKKPCLNAAKDFRNF